MTRTSLTPAEFYLEDEFVFDSFGSFNLEDSLLFNSGATAAFGPQVLNGFAGANSSLVSVSLAPELETSNTSGPQLLSAQNDPNTLDYSGTTDALVIDLAAGTVTEAARVLTVGDSITAGFFSEEGYRLPLWNQLTEDGLWIDFVGPESDPTSTLVDSDHFGIGGFRVDNYAPFMSNILATNPADVLVVMLGTNDALVESLSGTGNDPIVTVPQELLTLLRNADAAQPGLPILLAEIPTVISQLVVNFYGANADSKVIIDAINAQLPGIIATAQSEGINVTLVSTSSFSVNELDFDGLHPNDAGDALLASLFKAALSSEGGTTGGTFFGTTQPITTTPAAVIGSDAGDRIMGDGTANDINGGDGADWIEGRGGADMLAGGAGRDTFAYTDAGDVGDTISDFVSGEDRIAVDRSAFTGLDNVMDPTLVVDGAATGSTGMFLYNSTTGELSYDDDGAGVGAAVVLATLTGAPSLLVSDIVLIGGNFAPQVDTPMQDQVTDEFAPFSFTIPAGTFSDGDNDPLTLTATLDNGGALPTWLNFNPSNNTFSGFPGADDADVIDIRVTAEDPDGQSIFDVFQLTINDQIDPTQQATLSSRGDDAFTLYVNGVELYSGTNWRDVETAIAELGAGDVIAVEATNNGGLGGFFTDIRLNDGFKLGTNSDWKVANSVVGTDWTEQTFDDSVWANATEYGPLDEPVWSATLAGEPIIPADSIGQWIWDGTNSGAETVYLRYTIPFVSPQELPQLDNPIADQTGTEEVAFNFTVPSDTFSDANVGEDLTLSATLADGDPLPTWLTFDPQTETFSGTPDDPDVGTISVRVTATDPRGATVDDVFDLQISAVNDTPTVAAGIADQTTDEEAAFSFTLPATAFDDADGDTLTLAATLANGDPLPSWLSFDDQTGEFSGTPDDAEIGTITVRVTATDPDLESVFEDFDITVNPVNDAPTVANPIADQTTDEEAAFSFTVPANTFDDAEGDTLTLAATLANGDPLPSWLSFDDQTGEFTGTPDDAEVGTITVRVTATDPSLDAVFEDFDLTVNPVNDTPTVADGIADQSTDEEDAFSFTLPATAFDDADGDTLTLTATLANGDPLPTWLSFDDQTGEFSGTPDDAEIGTITVRVTATDPDLESVFEDFDITVNPVNDAPTVAAGIADQTTDEEAAFSFTLPATAFDDADGDTLTLAATLANGDPLPSWLSFDDQTGEFSGTPDDAEIGTITIRVTATDPDLESVFEDFDITVNPVNDAPVANDDTGAGLDNEIITIDVLGNDTDVDGPSLTITEIDGQAIVEGGSVDIGDAVVTLNGGELDIEADRGVNRQLSFAYTVSDGDKSDQATVTVDVTRSNNLPVAVDDTATVLEDETVTVNVLANDTDADTNAVLTITEVAGQAIVEGGTVDVGDAIVTLTGGQLDVAPKAGFFGALSFAYTVSDGFDSDAGQVDVTVTERNDKPTANDDAATILEDQNITIDVLANDTDENAGDTLSITEVNGQAITEGGSVNLGDAVIILAGGRLVVVPDEGFSGDVAFSYTASDGELSDTADVTVTVVPQSEPGTITFDHRILVKSQELLSTSESGEQGNGLSSDAVFSPDGSKVVFRSFSSNLVDGDTNGHWDVFMKDLGTGEVTMLSQNANGDLGNGDAFIGVFSPDGTRVAFRSDATNYASGDTNKTGDIFVKDLITGAITRVSENAAGDVGDDISENPVFSPDGRTIIFASEATNLLDGQIIDNGRKDLYSKDLLTGEVTLLTGAEGGGQSNGSSFHPDLSADGNTLVFQSWASNLVSDQSNIGEQIFVKNLVTGEVDIISTDASGARANGKSFAPVISADGTLVAFQSEASNLVPGDTNGRTDIFVKNLVTGDIQLVSGAANGGPSSSSSFDAEFSADGTKLLFRSWASNIVEGDTNQAADIFIADLVNGGTFRVSETPDGTSANASSLFGNISQDGLSVTFRSTADNLVDGDLNGQGDLFVAELDQGFAGRKGEAISLPVIVETTDAGDVVASTVFSGLPAGSVLSAGTSNADGSEWTINGEPPADLTITTPSSFAGEFEMTVTLTTQDGSDTDTVSANQTVTVYGDPGILEPADDGQRELVDLTMTEHTDNFDFSMLETGVAAPNAFDDMLVSSETDSFAAFDAGQPVIESFDEVLVDWFIDDDAWVIG